MDPELEKKKGGDVVLICNYVALIDFVHLENWPLLSSRGSVVTFYYSKAVVMQLNTTKIKCMPLMDILIKWSFLSHFMFGSKWLFESRPCLLTNLLLTPVCTLNIH